MLAGAFSGEGGLVSESSYQVCQNSTTQEDHVPPSGRVFDADLEFLLTNWISIPYLLSSNMEESIRSVSPGLLPTHV